MRNTSSIQFYCRPSKITSNGLAPIEMSVCINGNRFFTNLPLKCSPQEFNKKKQPKHITEYIDNVRVRVVTLQTEMLKQNIPLSPQRLKEYIRSGFSMSYTVEKLFAEYFMILEKRVGIDITEKVYKKYERVRDLFYEQIDKDREVTEITPAVIRKTQVEWNARYQLSTTSGMLTKLKTVITYAIQNDRLKINPFQGIKINKGKTKIEYLTEGELQSLVEVDCKGIERLEKVKDLLIFQAYGGGMSYCDLMNFKPETIIYKDNIGIYTNERQKTKISFTTIILPEALAVLSKYGGNLPLISNQKYNSYLKELQDLAGLKKCLHSHLLRKTYATMLLNKNVPITTISKMMGHTNTKITTQIYAHIQNESMITQVKNAMGL